MTLAALSVLALPPASTSISQWPRTVRRLRHIDTSIYVDNEFGGLHYGQVVWGAQVAYQFPRITWDWREVRPNVIALGDPMAVLSNVVLFDLAGKPIKESSKLLFLNRAIHSLPWQRQISALHPHRLH